MATISFGVIYWSGKPRRPQGHRQLNNRTNNRWSNTKLARMLLADLSGRQQTDLYTLRLEDYRYLYVYYEQIMLDDLG